MRILGKQRRTLCACLNFASSLKIRKELTLFCRLLSRWPPDWPIGGFYKNAQRMPDTTTTICSLAATAQKCNWGVSIFLIELTFPWVQSYLLLNLVHQLVILLFGFFPLCQFFFSQMSSCVFLNDHSRVILLCPFSALYLEKRTDNFGTNFHSGEK